MNRLWPRTEQEQLDYHLRRNDTPDFTVGQPGRVDLAHFLIDKILLKGDLVLREERPLKFVELGCGAGDVTGPYSDRLRLRGGDVVPSGYVEVVGVDVVPMSAETIGQRFPNMTALVSPVEKIEPFECDLLVMTEFLEHVHDPWSIVRAWMPKAHFAIIGHPLDEPNPPFETGHIWSYTLDDWYAWFAETGFHVWEQFRFPMGHWPNMVMGHGSRKDLPPYTP